MTFGCTLDWPQLSRSVGPCLRPGGNILTRRALEVCNLPPGARIVDVACGSGVTLEYLESTGARDLVGLDCSATLIEEAVSRLAATRLVQGRAEALPFEEDSFDALFCECALSVIDEKTAALDEYKRVVKPGGFLILSDVFNLKGGKADPPEDETAAPASGGHLTRDGLTGHLTRQGFEILLWEEHRGVLKEFLVRMIFAGVPLPESWGCGAGRDGKRSGRVALSYFLLVAQKSDTASGGLGRRTQWAK